MVAQFTFLDGNNLATCSLAGLELGGARDAEGTRGSHGMEFRTVRADWVSVKKPRVSCHNSVLVGRTARIILPLTTVTIIVVGSCYTVLFQFRRAPTTIMALIVDSILLASSIACCCFWAAGAADD